MTNLKIGILRNEDPESGKKWAIACEKMGLKYDIIDITSSDWLDIILNEKYDFFLLKPAGLFENYKKIYDERIYILSKVLGKELYPAYEECYIYENKKLLSDYLKAKGLPHPDTKVFYDKTQAQNFLKNCSYPVVAKTTIGASGSGVRIIRTEKQAKVYIKKAFSSKGIKRQFGPNRVIGSPSKWFKKAVKSPSFFISKLKSYFKIYRNGEKGYVIFQEYIPHYFEWRVVRIGDSWFAHKKIKYKDKASGSKGIEYVNPPLKLLDFCKKLCEDLHFHFMAIDLFEDEKGGYLINELQTIFGHVQYFILAVDETPGRYRFINNQWIFEPGDFNTNESFDLRLQTALELHKIKLK